MGKEIPPATSCLAAEPNPYSRAESARQAEALSEECGCITSFSRRCETEVFVGETRGQSSSRCAVQETDLEQVRLDHLLDRVFIFVKRGRQCPESDPSHDVSLSGVEVSRSVTVITVEGGT